jgi:hypothetical protein
MRELVCLIPLLCGCSTPAVRCDSHLRPINPPAAAGVPTAAAKPAASGTAQPATVPAGADRSVP